MSEIGEIPIDLDLGKKAPDTVPDIIPGIRGGIITSGELVLEALRGLSDREAYGRIWDSFRRNKRAICLSITNPESIVTPFRESMNRLKAKFVKRLIEGLPDPKKATDDEIAVVFYEVRCGSLEYGYGDSVQGFTMGEHITGRIAYGIRQLPEQRKKQIEISPMGRILTAMEVRRKQEQAIINLLDLNYTRLK